MIICCDMNIENEEFRKQESEDEKAQDWQHKQNLDFLSSFDEKLEYWVREVCKDKFTFVGRSHANPIPLAGEIDVEMVCLAEPITGDPFVDVHFSTETEFTLYPPKPATNEERVKMNKAFMDLVRRDLAYTKVQKPWEEYLDNWEKNRREPFEEP